MGLIAVWWIASKTVLVHVPFVQEISELFKKPLKPPRPQRWFTQIHNITTHLMLLANLFLLNLVGISILSSS
ncbi:hypothetical protein RND81_13G044300 [Saponaria officinalis]|uniref:Uncharacterized protein n=1 Tax=Saponaria officinalis TaxID=3572 RepID=A0AAW1GZH6_SAPOF